MRILCGTILAVAVAAVGAGAECVEKVAADFALVRDGAAVARFEFGAMPDEKMKAAAEKDVALFNRHLKEVTGCEIGSVNGQDARCPSIIRIDLKPIDRLDTRFEWKIEFPEKGLMRVEATTTSLFTALRQLLEEGCDARFLGTERCMFQFEPRRNVAVEARSRRSAAHSFSLLRDVYGAKGHKRELGLTDDGLFKYTHGIPVYAFPGDLYNRDGWPEAVMPIIKGKKLECPSDLYNHWQPCYSNPETARIASENIRGWLRKHPDARSITLGMNDNGGYCECDACMAMDADAEKSIFSNDPRSVSASYYTFANRVAEALAGEFPTLRIGLLAYTGTIMPPRFSVHPSIVPMMTLDTLSSGMDPMVRARQDGVIARWGRKVRETGIWDYSWGGGYFIPRVDFAGHAARLKHLYANGGRAYFGENSMPDALDGPKTYLIARLLENIDADPDIILGEWYARFAGRAAERPLREIYTLAAEYWRSDSMKRSALWPARDYIYNYPYANQFFALTPGFTAKLAALAREVREKAATPGEKARADVLLRHFERLDCMATFKGIAYMSPASGELETAGDAAKMLNDFADRAAALFAAWDRVRRYFVDEPDYDRKGVYSKATYEALPMLAEMFGKAAGFRDDTAVVAALKRIAALDCLPADVRRLLKGIYSRKAENMFSNPGFAKGLGALRVKTTLPHEIVDSANFAGGKALRIWPGRPNGDPNPGDAVLGHVSVFTLSEDLEPGVYMVSIAASPTASAAKGDLAVWRQTDGTDKGWEGLRAAALKKGEKHVFVQVRMVKDTEDGLNLKLRLTGFAKDDTLDVGDVKILRLADAGPSARAKSLSSRGITAREGTVRGTVRGEDAIVCKSDSYAFAHAVVDVPRILPNERLVFTLRATLPEGAKTGQLGAILYRQKKGGWEPGPQLLWNRRLSAKGWDGVEFSVSGAQLGKKSGKYLLILFKMKNTDAVAVSGVSWKVLIVD